MEYLKIGDADRALHIWRGEKIKSGESLSKVTREHCDSLGVRAAVIPMSDERVETVIETDLGSLNLHEFWVKMMGEPEVRSVIFNGLEEARACEAGVKAIAESERVIIGPSNPVTSVHPIISLKGIRDELRRNKQKVVAVSPIVGAGALSGPAEKLMNAFEIEVSVKGLLNFYNELISHLVVDPTENIKDSRDVTVHKTNIIMDNHQRRKGLADFVTELDL
jgi:LPPG:FO 2-phospho-L-lactate transferase